MPVVYSDVFLLYSIPEADSTATWTVGRGSGIDVYEVYDGVPPHQGSYFSTNAVRANPKIRECRLLFKYSRVCTNSGI